MTDVIDAAIEKLSQVGATIVSVGRLPDLKGELYEYSVTDYEFRRNFNAYLGKLVDESPVESAWVIYESDTIEGYVDFEGRMNDDDAIPRENCKYLRSLRKQTELQQHLLGVLEK